MLRMSWSTFRDRWPVFLGAIISVCLGVALVQSSLLTLVSAATAKVPPGLSAVEERAIRDGYVGAISLLGMTLGLAFFVAIFVVSSTFAFTVAQRRRDLALLRLTGAGRRQVRTLLVGEALLLGVIGSALGMLVGLPLMRLQTTMLTTFEFAPPGFTAQWRDWIIAVSAGTGVGVAVLGVLAASRRAARVQPLEALRDLGGAARVMTASRWVFGVLFLAGSVALLILVSAVGGEAALPLSINATFTLVTAFALLAPLVVPLVAAPFGLVFRGKLGLLAQANLRTGVRRSASTAAPIMVLVAFVVGMAGTTGTLTEASRQEITRELRGDLVLNTDRPVGDQVAAAPGVTGVSEQAPVSFDIGTDEGEDGVEWESADGLAIFPAAYEETHRAAVTSGNLADLRGASVAVTPSVGGWKVGDTMPVHLTGGPDQLRVVALLPETLSGPAVLLSPDLMPDGPRQYVVRATDPAAAATGLATLGQVMTAGAWVDEYNDQQQRTNTNVMVALMGMAMVYTLIAMVNAVVIAASDRRAEFAAARVTGLTRSQVVGTALAESVAVVAIGVLLGVLAATGTIVGMASAVRDMIGINVTSLPWSMFGAVVAIALAVVAVSSVLSTLSATRTPPIRLVAARE
ncbi:ABC transporter permease [Asanoa ishikariensis]|uniref:Putative ABC transport system permease protein n=1 Tax=Asanoa ishikariensis TaxID=137265 RepID=A0A1H3LHA1_9ACTN|nr:ABC transporter permease [Asanoa ishikariensis]GIF65484.1 ABC transporter permease [Asanoa ishikariensis]SDY63781.1 putative ABC transport system permease protein [Asanoa ishikariensis]